MKRSAKKSSPRGPGLLKTGLFSKEEASSFIRTGCAHLHSSVLGSQDPTVAISLNRLDGNSKNYPWEIAQTATPHRLTTSTERNGVIEKLVSTSLLAKRSQNRTRLHQVAEELLTNAFYHSYKNSDGSDKYDRREDAHLLSEEYVLVRFAENSNGMNLIVEDQGGSLTLKDFQRAFERCYQRKNEREISIEAKHSGAGLGLFMIFELSAHIHVTVERNNKTCFSVWIPDNQQFDPDTFSFNIFEE